MIGLNRIRSASSAKLVGFRLILSVVNESRAGVSWKQFSSFPRQVRFMTEVVNDLAVSFVVPNVAGDQSVAVSAPVAATSGTHLTGQQKLKEAYSAKHGPRFASQLDSLVVNGNTKDLNKKEINRFLTDPVFLSKVNAKASLSIIHSLSKLGFNASRWEGKSSVLQLLLNRIMYRSSKLNRQELLSLIQDLERLSITEIKGQAANFICTAGDELTVADLNRLLPAMYKMGVSWNKIPQESRKDIFHRIVSIIDSEISTASASGTNNSNGVDTIAHILDTLQKMSFELVSADEPVMRAKVLDLAAYVLNSNVYQQTEPAISVIGAGKEEKDATSEVSSKTVQKGTTGDTYNKYNEALRFLVATRIPYSDLPLNVQQAVLYTLNHNMQRVCEANGNASAIAKVFRSLADMGVNWDKHIANEQQQQQSSRTHDILFSVFEHSIPHLDAKSLNASVNALVKMGVKFNGNLPESTRKAIVSQAESLICNNKSEDASPFFTKLSLVKHLHAVDKNIVTDAWRRNLANASVDYFSTETQAPFLCSSLRVLSKFSFAQYSGDAQIKTALYGAIIGLLSPGSASGNAGGARKKESSSAHSKVLCELLPLCGLELASLPHNVKAVLGVGTVPRPAAIAAVSAIGNVDVSTESADSHPASKGSTPATAFIDAGDSRNQPLKVGSTAVNEALPAVDASNAHQETPRAVETAKETTEVVKLWDELTPSEQAEEFDGLERKIQRVAAGNAARTGQWRKVACIKALSGVMAEFSTLTANAQDSLLPAAEHSSSNVWKLHEQILRAFKDLDLALILPKHCDGIIKYFELLNTLPSTKDTANDVLVFLRHLQNTPSPDVTTPPPPAAPRQKKQKSRSQSPKSKVNRENKEQG